MIYKDDILNQFKEIVENNYKIGILVSGGIDSGVALYLLLLVIKESGLRREIHSCTVTKTPDAEENAKKVVDLITSKFDTTINHHVVPSKFTNEQHMKHTNSGVMLLLDKVDIIIMATNAIVPTPLLTDRDNPTRSENAIEQITRPFLNYTKDITIGLAIEYDLIELLSISHSCIKQSYNRCYQCYWCKEREWGFAKNNYSDPGTN